jgi:hypothetical protein
MAQYFNGTLITVVLFLSAFSAANAEEFALKQTENGYDIFIDGKLFAGYLTDVQGTPIIYPIIGPTGKKMTRDYPMLEHQNKTESKDHPHHRSLWFTHGDVNGLDFWTLKKQKIVHRKFVKAECNANTAILVSENDWLDDREKPLCTDVRNLRFGLLKRDGGVSPRTLDFDITITAVQDSVTFGDTKEGTFGIRVPGTMDVIAKKRNPAWGGRIINADGLTDGETWGKRSAWVDYTGPVEGETVGIAVLNHPSSFRYPTYWHVRDYGLFAANPFGVHHFEGTDANGSGTLKKGDSITLRYQVIFHTADTDAAGLSEAFDQYRNSTRP